jgi:hypothetical protein
MTLSAFFFRAGPSPGQSHYTLHKGVSMLVPVQIGERTMMMTMEQAINVHNRKIALQVKSDRISRELRQGRMLPSCRTNQFAGWIDTTSRVNHLHTSDRVLVGAVAKLSRQSDHNPHDYESSDGILRPILA